MSSSSSLPPPIYLAGTPRRSQLLAHRRPKVRGHHLVACERADHGDCSSGDCPSDSGFWGRWDDQFYQWKKSTQKYPKAQLWTFPLIVGGPLGVVSAAEFIGGVFFVGYILWALYFYTLRNLALLSTFKLTSA
ncbi:unnamed protein product [Linum tenue]|uniref:Uncharacterized protein n=1 Tax=Linum tenue TaxID=586396 RepID=A0AAV0GV53_9ROSI|nr:unnamed protein product [Linum tenue]